MKIFGYRSNCGSYGNYGVTCGVIIAESEEEARKIIGLEEEFQENGKIETIFEIPFQKGYTFIGEYSE